MDINEYQKTYQIPIGTKVTINECHSTPALVGKQGKVVGWVDAAVFGYPLAVNFDEPIYVPVPGVPLAASFRGPHFCRPDELTVVSDIPDMFKSFDNGGSDEKV